MISQTLTQIHLTYLQHFYKHRSSRQVIFWKCLVKSIIQIWNSRMLSKAYTLLLLLWLCLIQVSPQCTVERCCFASPCSNSYCQQKNTQTWISSQNFANYGFTKLVLSNGSCLPCPYNCKSCSSQTVCSTCASGYYMSNSTCGLCGYMCASCVVVNGISKCSTCSGSTYLDSTTATCKNCPSGASVCSSATVISQCQTGYHLTSNSLFCLACPSNCLNCPSSSSACSSCATGYYLNSSLCYQCTKANCAACVFFSNNQYCVGCNTGYYVAGGSCFACSANCNSCSSSTCNVCAGGHHLSGGTCQAVTTAIDNCNTYQSASSCSACASGYYLSNNQCQPCSILCTTCSGLHFGACSACATNNELFNQMCLPTGHLSSTVYQLYLSFPSALSSASGGSQDCNHYLYSGTSLTINLNDLAGSQVTLKWRIFSVGQSATYTATWTNTAGSTSSTHTTSISPGQTYTLCSTSSSTYHLSIGSATISSVKVANTLTFASSSTLALQEVLVVVTKCSQLCTECTSALCSQCQMTNLYTQDASCVYSCSTGYYIYANTTSGQNSCLQTCPTGSYALSTNLSCVGCQSPCLTCLGQTQCLTCITNYFLTSSNTCLQTCPYQYYGQPLTKSCQKCVGRCNQCLDQTRCLSCSSGFYYASNNSCLDSCSSTVGLVGMYANLTTLKCESCNAGCLNCLYESSRCTQCHNGSVFFNNTCLGACPSGYYSNASAVCLVCSYPCGSCTGTANNCTSCLGSYLLNNTCLTDCPVGYFQDNTGLTCTACLSSCAQCIQSSSNCQQCSSNFYLFNSTCLSNCPATYYPNSTSLTCLPCVGTCHTCSSDTICLSCSSNFLFNGSCLNSKSCPSGYYAQITTLVCTLCASSCLTCEYASTRCTSCYTNGSLTLLDNGQCLSACGNSSTYASNGVCVACSSPCLTCTSATACLSCQDGYMLSGTSCSTSCSAGYFFSTTTSTCQACSSSCLICTSALFCQKCQTSTYLKSTNSTSNQCVSTCGAQMYVNLVSGSCSGCLYPCMSCSSNVDCLSCQDGVLYQNRCVSVCPDTTFLNNGSSSCDACGGQCLTCTNSATHCLTCKTGYFLSTIDNTCNLVCPTGTYSQNVTQQCLACSSTCSACINSTYCTACIPTRTYLYTSTNLCLSDCPLGFFPNTTSSVCDACSSKCLTCASTSTNCQSCAANYYLVRLSVSSYDCVVSCPAGYYIQSQNCQACIFPCLTCSSATACTTCVTGTYFYSNTSACLLACPSNSFLNTTAQTCTLCTSPCASCRSPTFCLSCLNNLYLSSGSCLSTCPAQYYSDTTQICTQCTGLCKTCSSKYYCLSCLTGYLSNGYCYSSCPAGTYANLNVSQCQACISPCLECTYSTTYCTRCSGGLVEYQGTCSSSCPVGTYLSSGSCLACQFPCINCSSASTCSQCLGGYLLYNSLTCINDTVFCPNDLYKMDGKFCIPKASCPTSYYTDSQLKTCSATCSASKYLSTSNQSCEYSCSSGQWVGANMVCKDWALEQPVSLMAMTAVSFISSNIMNVVVDFNQSALWMSGATNLYTITSSTARLLANGTGLQYNLNSAAPTHLILKVASMPNQVSFVLPANYVVSSSTNYPLQNPNITLELPAYVGYDYNAIYQGMLASQFGSGLGWFILLLTIIYLFKNRISHLYTLWDTVQLLYVIILLQIQYPPALNQFLNGLSTTLFLGFPNMFSQGSARTVSARPFYAYTHDNNFLRNAGPSLTLGLIVFIIYLFFKLVAELNKRTQKVKNCMNNYPKIKRFVYETLLRYRWHYASDVFFLTYLPVFLFAAAQIYHMKDNPGRIFSNASCIISLVMYLIFPIFAGVKLHRHFPNISKGKHSQNLRCFYRGIDKTSKFGVFLIMIRYFRKIVYALVVGVFSSRPMYALPILMFTSVLMALFILLNLPFKKRLSNIVEIINQVSIAVLFLMLALVNFNNQQNYTGFNVALSYFCTGLLIFILLLLVFEVFVRSLFKLKSEEQIRKEQEMGLEGLSQSQLRKKAGEFFDFMFPRLRKTFGLGDESQEESFNYEEGDSQDSQNNFRREEEWGLKSEQEHHSDEFKHYSESSQATDAKKPNVPDYLIRCVKEI